MAEIMPDIPRDKVLSESRCGKKAVSIRRRYVSALNQVCTLDSNYEYDYALYLDYLYEKGNIAGWIKNTTRFGFTQSVQVRGRTIKSHVPDFIIFGKHGGYEIHEVKGWMNERSETLVRRFKEDYPDLIYKIIGKDAIISLQRQFGNRLWGWAEVR